jgi:hypothetical protein
MAVWLSHHITTQVKKRDRRIRRYAILAYHTARNLKGDALLNFDARFIRRCVKVTGNAEKTRGRAWFLGRRPALRGSPQR